MRKLIVAAFVSLDGVMQGPGGPEEDTSGGFRFGGWMVPYDDDVVEKAVDALFENPFELVLGRRTYDIWATYWPHVAADSPNSDIARKFNSVAKHVVTHRPDTLDWKGSKALQGDLADAVRALKQQDGADLLVQGSSEVVQQLLAAGLVDELRLQVFPVLLGKGKRLFGDNAHPSEFKLADSTTSPKGVLITRHLRSGEVRTGSF